VPQTQAAQNLLPAVGSSTGSDFPQSATFDGDESVLVMDPDQKFGVIA